MKTSVRILIMMGLWIAGAVLWSIFSYPRYQQIDLSIDRTKAMAIARHFLASSQDINPDDYQQAAVFNVDYQADRYLQKTLGTKAAKDFIKKYDYDLFFWTVRFFKEKQKEEYRIDISSKDGELIGFDHYIKETDPRPDTDKDKARVEAFDFLAQQYQFIPADFVLRRDDAKKMQNRTDFTFSWQHKDVDIAWDQNYGGGAAKLLTTVMISGKDILYFHKYRFDIPDGFKRHIETLKQTGDNLSLLFRLLYLAMLTMAIFIVVNHKGHLVGRTVKPLYLGAGLVFALVMLAEIFNNFHAFMFGYPTTQAFGDFMVRQIIESIVNPFFLALAFILPGLAGESLRYECDQHNPQRGLLKPVLSSFFTRSIALQVMAGYAVAVFILGVQGFIFDWGFKYAGVWDELSWLAQPSTAYVGAWSALLIGFQASFSEEVMFRLFGINVLRKWGIGAPLAVVITSLVWGFGHTGYAVYPMWFRGVEVSLLGIVLGVTYLRYGFIACLVAHFLMDVFLTVLPYLINPQLPFNFYSSIVVLSLPLLWAAVAFVLNRSSKQKPLTARLNVHQQFNRNLLLDMCKGKSPQDIHDFKQSLLMHGWDPAVVHSVHRDRDDL